MAVIDVGLKSEGRVPLREFAAPGQKADLKIGDEVEVYVDRVENSAGEAMLSRDRARREAAWDKLEGEFSAGNRVEGVIFGRVKGGFTVDLGGAVAFLPGSQVDIRPVRDVQPLMDLPQPFQILKMDRRRGNIVVSRRAILEETRAEQRSRPDPEPRRGPGDRGRGQEHHRLWRVRRPRRHRRPAPRHRRLLQAGQSPVRGAQHRRHGEGADHPHQPRHAAHQPRHEAARERSRGKARRPNIRSAACSSGRVTNITEYGAFVELEPGIEGLVHVSEMSWTKKNVHPGKIVSTSQEVDVKVLEVDEEKRRISLGLKQAQENPWAAFAEKHPVGSAVEGEVKNATEFGLFIGLDGDVDGMVHMSDIAWGVSGEEALQLHRKGETVKAQVLDVDVEKERISLGMKQLEGGGSAAGASGGGSSGAGGVKKGETVTVTVRAVQDAGLDVQVGDDGAIGFIKRGDLGRDRDEQRPERFQVGQKFDAMVTGFDRSKKPNFSIKALQIAEEKQAVAQYGSSDSGASLGDILGEALKEAQAAKTTKKK